MSDGWTTIDDHPGTEPDQPPLGTAPSIHPSARVRRARLGPWTAVGARTKLVDSELAAYSYVVEDADVIYATIGKFCSIARAVRLNPGEHPTWRAAQHHFMYRASNYALGADEAALFAWRRAHPVRLGHDVWIGHGAVVMAGVTIATGAVVGAGAVVTKDVAPYTIVTGVPARSLRRRVDEATAERLLALDWWDWPHDRLAAALDDFRTLSAAAFVERYGG